MSSSEANLMTAKDSVPIKAVYSNNEETTDNNDKFLILNKININNSDTFKKSIQNQLEEVIKEKKKNNSKNSEPIATNSNTQTGEIQGKYPEYTVLIIGDSILNGILQARLSRNGRAVKVHNFQGAAVDDKKHQVIPLICKELSFLIIHTDTNDAIF